MVENPFVSVLDRVLRERGEVVDGEWIDGTPMEGKIAMEDIWTILGIRTVQRSQEQFELLGDAMKQLGWERDRLRVGAGKRSYCYERGPKPHRRIVVTLISAKDGTPAEPVAAYEEGRY
jgi:hypothetical protein